MAKAQAIPFKNKNFYSAIVKSNEINLKPYSTSLSLFLSLSVYLSLFLSLSHKACPHS
jgi:hypothetical protein